VAKATRYPLRAAWTPKAVLLDDLRKIGSRHRILLFL